MSFKCAFESSGEHPSLSPLKGRDKVQDGLKMSMVSPNETCNGKHLF